MDLDEQDQTRNRPDTNRPSSTVRSSKELTDHTPLHSGNTNSNSNVGMSTMASSPVRSDIRRYESDVPHPARIRPAPPLQPYVTAEKRVHPPRISGWRTVPDPGLARYRAHPDAARPPPIHNPPTGNNWQRQLERGPDPPHARSSAYSHHSPSNPHTSHHPHPYLPSGDKSPRSVPASGSGTGAASTSRVQLPPFATLPGPSAMQRSRSARSQQSIPMSRNPSHGSSGQSHRSSGNSSVIDENDENSNGYPSTQPMFDSRRRTRALMTKSQMSELKKLWRDTKFPANEEREVLGQRIGLTPRQIQVWFQNQRQKIRKEINESKIPAGAHPQDYNDLDKSPRSRKLTVEATGSGDRAAPLSASSSERSGSSFRHHVSGLGIQTPRDDDSRSIATGSSISGQYPTTAESYKHPQTGFWDQSRHPTSHQSPSEPHPHPFAFHKPPTPSSQPRPPPYDQSSSYLDPRPSTNLNNNTHYTPNTYASIPPPPLRHAATDGEVLLRRRSNSLENLNRGMGLGLGQRPNSNYATSHPPPRARTHAVTSELPPSLAALMVPGPMDSTQNMQRLPSDPTHGHGEQGPGPGPGRGSPSLPPPRGWSEERPNGLDRGHTDPHRRGGSGGSRLPGYQSMFGRDVSEDRRR